MISNDKIKDLFDFFYYPPTFIIIIIIIIIIIYKEDEKEIFIKSIYCIDFYDQCK